MEVCPAQLLTMGTSQGRGRHKLHWVDNVTKWTGRSVDELRKAVIKREQVMALSPVMRRHLIPIRGRGGHGDKSVPNDDEIRQIKVNDSALGTDDDRLPVDEFGQVLVRDLPDLLQNVVEFDQEELGVAD